MILMARRIDALAAVSDACVAAHKESGLQHGGRFATIQLDLSDKTQVATLWDKVPQDLSDVDVLGAPLPISHIEEFSPPLLSTGLLVNNAGFVRGMERVGEIAQSDIEDMFATNVLAMIQMTQLLVKRGC